MTYIIFEKDLKSLWLRFAGLEREEMREFVCFRDRERERRNEEVE